MVDGDKSLVVADQYFISIAERNMEGIVPLYYNMRKASPTLLNNENIYAGLNAAFVGGNIGIYSNEISKIWNNDVFVNGTDEQKQEAIDAVKLLCMENNFVIDYAKTLYKPTRPPEKNEMITKYTHSKLPSFFIYAKDKESYQVAERNNSFVNKIFNVIKDVKINTSKMDLGEFDYTVMMNNKNITCPQEVIDIYNELNPRYRYMINMKDEYMDNMSYVANEIRARFAETGYSEQMIADMLVYFLYKSGRRKKQIFWFCYGRYIVNNLRRNIRPRRTEYVQCADCGEWFEVEVRPSRKSYRCKDCQHKANNKSKARYRNSRKNKVVGDV